MPTFRIPVALALGGLAFWLVLVITQPPGPGLDPDAVSYVGAAGSLVRTGTLEVPEDDWALPDSTTPLAHFPPGFSAVLAVPLAFGMPPVQGARLVEAIAALVTVTLAAWLVSETVGTAAGVAAAITIMVTPAVAAVHENVLSEPLFLAALVAVLALMTRAPRRPLVAGAVAAAASLVRYAGVAAIGAVALWWLGRMWEWGERGWGWRRRIGPALLAALPGVVAQALWVARTIHVSHEESIRRFSVYGQLGPTLAEGASTLGAWLAPVLGGWWGAMVAIAIAAMLVALGTRAVQQARAEVASKGERKAGEAGAESGRDDRSTHSRPGVENAAPGRLLGAVALLAGAYVAVVVASRLFADPDIPLDQRLLAPLMVLVEIGVIVALAVAWRTWRTWRTPVRVIAAALLLAWWGGSLATTSDDAEYALETGNDYADVQWSGSRLIAWVEAHEAGRLLFTNFPTPLYFHAGRTARLLPQTLTPKIVRAFADTLARRDGVIVAFERSSDYAARPDSLLRMLPVREVARFPEGGVWEIRQGTENRETGSARLLSTRRDLRLPRPDLPPSASRQP